MKPDEIEHRIKKQDSRIELVPLKTVWGEAKAWEILSVLNPKDVCRGAKAEYDAAAAAYSIYAFGLDFDVSLSEERSRAITPKLLFSWTDTGIFSSWHCSGT